MRYRLAVLALCLIGAFASESAWANRYYSPEMGRFISRDTIFERPAYYQYTLSKPTLSGDTLGLFVVNLSRILKANQDANHLFDYEVRVSFDAQNAALQYIVQDVFSVGWYRSEEGVEFGGECRSHGFMKWYREWFKLVGGEVRIGLFPPNDPRYYVYQYVRPPAPAQPHFEREVSPVGGMTDSHGIDFSSYDVCEGGEYRRNEIYEAVMPADAGDTGYFGYVNDDPNHPPIFYRSFNPDKLIRKHLSPRFNPDRPIHTWGINYNYKNPRPCCEPCAGGLVGGLDDVDSVSLWGVTE